MNDHAIVKSVDRGRTWSRSDHGITGNPRVNAFASFGEVIVAATDAGVFLSQDQARTWRAADGAVHKPSRIIALASLDQTLFAAEDRKGLLASSDFGNSWRPLAAFPSKNVRSLLADGSSIFAGTDSEGVMMSKNNGQTWRAMREGLPANSQVLSLISLNGRLFAGLYSNGLYTLDPGNIGQGWSKIGNVSPLTLAPSGHTLIAGHNPGGIHWSDDGGSNWSRGTLSSEAEILGAFGISEGFSQIPVWDLSPGANLSMAGAGAGIYFSEDRGHTWTRAHSGLPAESSGISFLVKTNYVLAGIVSKGDPCSAHSTTDQIKTGLIYGVGK